MLAGEGSARPSADWEGPLRVRPSKADLVTGVNTVALSVAVALMTQRSLLLDWVRFSFPPPHTRLISLPSLPTPLTTSPTPPRITAATLPPPPLFRYLTLPLRRRTQDYSTAFSSVHTDVSHHPEGDREPPHTINGTRLSRLVTDGLLGTRQRNPRRAAEYQAGLGESLCALLHNSPARVPLLDAFQVRARGG
jgi:hypothetical protein